MSSRPRAPRDGLPVVKRVAAVGPATLSVAAGRLRRPRPGRAPLARSGARWGRGIELSLRARLFLLGDNPPESLDSRDYGSVPIEAVSGRVLLFGRWARS